MRLFSVTLLLGVLIPTMACGSGQSTVSQGGPVSGNWQITLNGATPPGGTPPPALVFTGFLIQSGDSVTGNLILPLPCAGVSPVTGTVNGSNVSLNIDQFGETISLTGSGTAMGGSFTSQSGTCNSPSSGTWSAVQVAPISGSFQGTFTSGGGLAVDVTGTLSQGPNTGNSTATLSGTLAVTSEATFCSYVLPGTITGLISGTAVQLDLYGEDGIEYAQLGNIGPDQSSGVAVTPDGTSLSGPFFFPPTSASCYGDQGTFTLSFP